MYGETKNRKISEDFRNKNSALKFAKQMEANGEINIYCDRFDYAKNFSGVIDRDSGQSEYIETIYKANLR